MGKVKRDFRLSYKVVCFLYEINSLRISFPILHLAIYTIGCHKQAHLNSLGEKVVFYNPCAQKCTTSPTIHIHWICAFVTPGESALTHHITQSL